jgi:hypothetical protein
LQRALSQASLVAGGRVRLHKRVGVAAGLTAVAAIAMNLVTVLRGVHDGSVETGLGPREFVDRFHYDLQILVTIGLLICLAAYDLRSTRRLHPVTVLGVFAFLILPLLTFPLLSGAAANEWVIGLG